MEKPVGSHTGEPKGSPRVTAVGGVPLDEERLRLLAPYWERTWRGLRAMDDLSLGETEPASVFVWEEEQP